MIYYLTISFLQYNKYHLKHFSDWYKMKLIVKVVIEVKEYYLAYGSNLNLKQMKERCPSAHLIGTSFLNGYRLIYKGTADDSSYLTIEAYDGACVPIGVFEVSKSDMLILDQYEDYPTIYSKKIVSLIFDNKEIKALIYIMNDGFDYHLPSQSYQDTCIKGYMNFDFDQSILEKAYHDTYLEMQK